MSEKRFRVNDLVKYSYSEIGEYTDENHTDRPLRNDEVVELLNELHEKNRELQRHLDVMRSGALTDDKRIKELYDKNKQLKKSIKRQQSSNDECAKLIKEQQKENEQLKAQLKDCEKRVTDKEVEWSRNNTVWEQMPSNKKTFTTTSVKEDYK